MGEKAKGDAAAFLSRIGTPLYVRCADDLQHLSEYADARLAADVSFLDSRLFEFPPEGSGLTPRGLGILSFPRYSSHWQRQREWLTEAYYRSFVEGIARTARDIANRVEFLEFDSSGRRGPGDADYWAYLGIPVREAGSVEDGLSAMRAADFVYAGRLHAGLMASLLSIPVAAFAYHHKFRCLDEIGVPVMGLDDKPVDIVEPRRATRSIVREVRARGIASFQEAARRADC